MSKLLFQVRGKLITADELPENATPAPPRIAKEREAAHNGFAVEGFPPGYIAECERLAKEAYKRWCEMSEEEQRRARAQGNREAKPWDEATFLRKTKPRRVAKPYSMPQAAADCMALAVKAGWRYMRINELIREAS